MGEAKDFRKANGALDESKFTATVKSGIDSAYQGGEERKVIGVLDVEGEPNALELLVEKPLKDNSTVSVTFQDKRNTSSVITSSNTVYCKLTDGYQPSALKVNVVDNHTLEVEFSEAVLRTQDAKSQGQDMTAYAADLASNYAIDTLGLQNYWNVEGVNVSDVNAEDSASNDILSKKDNTPNDENEKGTVKVGVYRNAVDKRHIVTITLGEGRYLSAGKHSLSLSNIGDWAAATDGWRNIVNTATVDFEVPADTSRPSFSLEVQSPEQYKLTANCDIALVNKNNTFKTADSSAVTNDVVELQQLINGAWVTISNAANNNIGDGNNPIMVSRIVDAQTGANTNEYLVETRSDWTRVLDTKGTNNHYYRNSYRLRIAANTIKNLSNGLTNEEITLNLSEDPIMKSMDGASPVIDKIEQAVNANGSLTSNYHVTFSEPVKMNNTANAEGTTPTQDTADVSPYTAYFVKRDASQKTVQAEVGTEHFINAEDTMIRVNPVGTLDAGDWDLYVRGASDDLGNTAATLSGMITVEAQTVTTNFRVVWAAVSTSLNYSDITAGQGNYIFVKFNKPITVAGGSTNVGSTLNYQLNGNPLPTGSNIRAHIQGYDDKVDRIDSITIELPKTSGSWLGSTTMNYSISGLNSVLTISNAVTSTEGDTLTTEPGYNLPYQFGESGQELGDKSVYDSKVLTALGDATWGNHEDEKWDKITASLISAKDKHDAYVKALKDALASDKYRKIVLDPKATDADGNVGVIVTDLSASRIVNIDLNGCEIKGNVSISTTEAADKVSILNNNDTLKTAQISGKTTNTEKDATLTINTPNSSVEIAQNINIVRGSDKAPAITVNGVTPNTLITQATITGNVVLSGSNMGFEQRGTLSSGKIVIDTTGKIYLRGTYKGETVEMTKAGDLEITDANVASGLTIEAAAKGAKITVRTTSITGDAKNITVVAKAADVEIRQNITNDDNKVALKVDGGNFIQKDESGNAIDSDSVRTDIEPDGVQKWLDRLHVINGSELGQTATEVITVSAVSGGSLFNDGKNIAENLETEVNALSAEKNPMKYVISSVVPTVNSSYLEYNATNKTVGVKASVNENSIKAPVTDRFTVAIKVTWIDNETKETKEQVVTKTIKVTINPAE